MAYVQWPPLPAYSAVIASDDVYLNTTTLLTVIGSGGGGAGTPPSSAPTAPTTGGTTPSQTLITIEFSAAGITGSAPITYGARYSTTSTGPWTTLTVVYDSVKQKGQATASGLIVNTTYYFQSSASNPYGTLYSASSPINTAAVGVPPGNVPNPDLLTATNAVIGLYIDTAAVTGDIPITYSGRYGTVSGTFTDNINYSLSSGTIYTGTTANGPPNTTYYFETIAENPYGTVSTIAPYPAFSTTNGGGTPPNFAPTVPQPFPSNLGSLISTFYIDVTGITGTEPITYNILYGPFNNQTSTVQAVQSTGNIYYASVPGLSLVGATYFNSQAINSVGSTISAPPLRLFAGGVGSKPLVEPSSITLDVAAENVLSIYSDFANAGNGNPQALVYADYGLTSTFTSSINLLNTSATIWSANVTGLMSSTTYYFQTRIYNSFSTLVNPTVTALSTTGGGTPPANVPNAELVSATTDSIDLYIDTVGVSGNTPITYTGLFGVTPGGWTANLNYALSSGTIYTATAAALPSSTTYYFGTVAQNAAGTTSTIAPYPAFSTTGGAPPPPVTIANVSTNIGVGFLTFGTGGFSSIILDTSQNVNVGNWQADGVITYSGTPPGGISGPQYLSTQQGAGSKIILSLGGASDGPDTLSTMFGLESGGSYDLGAENLANSLAYAYFGGSGSNPLGFAKTDFDGFAFDGIDLDIEAVTPSTTTLQVFLSTLKGNPAFAGKIVTAAPQTPYLTQATTSGLNANNTFTSFSAMNPATVLNEVYTGNAGNQLSVLSPTSGGLIDYQFVQCYNNASYSYPTGANSGNWNNVVAAWGIQSLQCGYSANKPYPKNIYAFATTDGNPIWDPVGDASAFNASLVTANSTIRGFSTTSGVLPYSSVTIADWCAGIGYWAANTNVTSGSSSLPVLSTMYGQPSTLNNMPTDTCMTYGGVFNSNSWGLTGFIPIPNARGY